MKEIYKLIAALWICLFICGNAQSQQIRAGYTPFTLTSKTCDAKSSFSYRGYNVGYDYHMKFLRIGAELQYNKLVDQEIQTSCFYGPENQFLIKLPVRTNIFPLGYFGLEPTFALHQTGGDPDAKRFYLYYVAGLGFNIGRLGFNIGVRESALDIDKSDVSYTSGCGVFYEISFLFW